MFDTMIYQKSCISFAPKDRYISSFEYMFVFSKGKPKTFSPLTVPTKHQHGKAKVVDRRINGEIKTKYIDRTPARNKDNIWQYTTGNMHSTKDRIAFQHPAIFPEKLAEDHILSWTNPNDLVFESDVWKWDNRQNGTTQQ